MRVERTADSTPLDETAAIRTHGAGKLRHANPLIIC